MPIPGDLTSATVTGTFTTASGQPVTGVVTFTPSQTLLDPTSQMVIPASGSSYPLSSMGTFTSDPLICTDNVDLEPQSGWLYVVRVELQDLQPYSFTTALTSSPSTVDLSALEPISVSIGSVPLVPVASGSGLPTTGGTETGTLVLDGNPPIKIPGAQDGWILISDGSGNFTVQANPGGSGGSAASIDGVTVSGTVAVGRTIIVTAAGGSPTATWQLPLQLDFTNSDVAPLAATALASSSAGLSGPPGITQAAVADHVHPTTGLVVSGETAGGDLGSTYPNPQVTTTHLASPLPVLQGGTGSGTQNFVDLSTTQASIGGTKTFTGAVNVPGTGLVSTSAAPKSYVDGIASGLSIQAAAVAATTGAESYTISSGNVTAIATLVVDGQTLSAGQVVLVKDAPSSTGAGSAGSSQPGNGLYSVSSVAGGNLGLTRTTGMSGGNTPIAAFVFVKSGTVNMGSGWVVTTPAAGSGAFTYGSGVIQWTQFSSSGSVGADGTSLTQSGSVISLTVPVTVARGGTNAITQQAAINNLAGAVTSGDYLRGDGTNVTMSGLAAADLTGTVGVTHGGTGAGTAAAAITALTGTQANGKYLRSDGTNATLSSLAGADMTGTVAIANGGTASTSAAAAITALGAADLTSAQTLQVKTLKNTSLTFDNLGSVTTSQSLSLANGNVQQFTLGASVAVSAITGPGGAVACDLTLYIKQATSGGPFTITSWPGSVTWLGGSSPTIQQGSGAVTVVTFESLDGGTTWFGAQVTGAPSLPLTIALGGTGATDSTDALAALAGQGVLGIFGNGNDGTVVFDGTTTILGMAPSSNVYTMTRDIMCTGITVNSGVTVRTSSASGTYRIFCQGTVTINTGSPGGTITASGNAAGTAPAAGAVLASGSLVGGRAGGGGGAAGTGAGTVGGNAGFGVAGGTGGNGGGGGAGGAGGTVSVSGTNAVANVFNTPFPVLTGLCGYGGFSPQIGFGAGGGGGGGATGAAGGGGGGGGGVVAIFAYNVVINSGGTITVAGGAGHAGAGGNAGGGGGGAGGLIIAYTLTGWTQSGTTTVTGGAGGALSGSGTAGAAGGVGNVVNVVLTS